MGYNDIEQEHKGFKFTLQRVPCGFVNKFNIIIENQDKIQVMKSGPYSSFEKAFHFAIRWINEVVWRIRK